MIHEAVLGIDVGTTSVKAVMMAATGEVVAEASSDSIATSHPQPGSAEQDPAGIWAAVVQAVRSTAELAPQHRTVALAMAAQSGSLVPIGADGQAAPALLWMDTRAVPLVESWGEQRRDAIRQTSGWSASAGLGLSSLAWLLADGTPAGHRWARFASVDDYVMHRLTGRWTTNPSNAAGMQMMDVTTHSWSQELCQVARVTVDQLSDIARTGTIVAPTAGAGLAELGLEPDTLVFVGGHDQACAAYGLGVQDPGSVLLSAGTAWVVTVPTDQAVVSALPENVNLSPHISPDRWTVSQSLGGLGAMIAWWRAEAYEEPLLLDEDLVATVAREDAPLFVPALSDEQRTAWGRFEPGDSDAQLVDRAVRARAVIDAAAFEVRRALSAVSSAVGNPRQLTLVGGAAKSEPVVQVLADVTALPISVQRGGSWPGRGAARIAAEALGWTAASAALDAPHIVSPDLSRQTIIAHRYDAYCRLIGTASKDKERGTQ